ncbi:MAG: hypothetical protein ACLR8Y_16835 [Alistipes indistinctus]
MNRTESAVKKRNVAAADTSVVASAQQQAPAGRSGAAADSRPVPPETLSVLSEETGVTSGAVPVVTKELSVSKPDSMRGRRMPRPIAWRWLLIACRAIRP